MAGASNIHVFIILSIASMLRNHMRGKGCQAYIADTKAHIETILKQWIYIIPLAKLFLWYDRES